jgi:predicted AlkP superfamily pyrophosphatase or phosphodiesterase
MNEFNTVSMTQIAATVADILGVEPPNQAEEKLDWLSGLLKSNANGKIDRGILYNPDAIAQWLFQKYTADFAPVLKHTQTGVPLKTVMPSITPVCFASMYTGTPPEIHGIEKYEKPVVAIDSLFDALIQAGKRVAIVAVKGSSMSKIYAGKELDYYIETYDEEVCEKAKELIEKDEYDFISVYTQSYDDLMHMTGTESEYALDAMKSQINIFEKLAIAVDKSAKAHNTFLGFATDHGVHTNENGGGTHGADIPEDLNIMHFYGIKPAG